jgi:ankyrin repeat protein
MKLPMKNDMSESVEATALHKACLEGYTPIALSLIIDGKADVNILSSEWEGVPPAHYAIKKRHLDTLKAVVENSFIDVNMRYSVDGITLLMVTSIRNLAPITDFLLSAGAKADVKSTKGHTALFLACELRHSPVIKSLVLKGGADVNARNGEDDWTALMEVASEGDLPLVKFLIEEGGGSPNLKTHEGWSSFFMACTFGHTQVVRYLMEESNADIDARSNNNFSPVGMATLAGQMEVVKILIEEGGVDVDDPFGIGATPLKAASNRGHAEIVKYLIGKGADVDLYGGNFTALCMATAGGHLDVVKILIEVGGADANIACDEIQWTPLHQACKNGFFDVVVYLVQEAEADVTLTTGDGGKTALEIAEEFSQDRIVDYLQRR